jgi:RNA polymerase sigma-70 factor (ECF subfamily)
LVSTGERYFMASILEGKHDTIDSDTLLLIKRAAGGDSESFGRLYDIYLEPIYRYVYHHVGESKTAEDIVQDVFIKAWKAIRSCRGKETTFKAWLYRIAHNHTIDYFRCHRDESRIDSYNVVDESSSPDASLDKVEEDLEVSRVFAEMEALPESQRQVVILKFIEGLGNGEVSRIMGKSQGAIRVLQVRALAGLRKRMLAYGRKDD